MPEATPSLATPEDARRFLLKARALRHAEPDEFAAAAALAAAIGESLPARSADATDSEDADDDARATADLKAELWAEVGNARRVLGLHAAAEDAFTRAGELLAAGRGEPQPAAAVSLLVAALLADQRRFDDALRLLEQARALFARRGDRHATGETFVHEGLIRFNRQEAIPAARLFSAALCLLEPARGSKMIFSAVHNLAVCAVQLGDFARAEMILAASEDLYAELGGEIIELRRRWLLARIAASTGREAEAAEILDDLRRCYARRGLGLDEATATLDLALVSLSLGRTSGILGHLAGALRVFRSLRIEREALAVIVLLENSLRAEEAALA